MQMATHRRRNGGVISDVARTPDVRGENAERLLLGSIALFSWLIRNEIASRNPLARVGKVTLEATNGSNAERSRRKSSRRLLRWPVNIGRLF